jgi:hypothetical protein
LDKESWRLALFRGSWSKKWWKEKNGVMEDSFAEEVMRNFAITSSLLLPSGPEKGHSPCQVKLIFFSIYFSLPCAHLWITAHSSTPSVSTVTANAPPASCPTLVCQTWWAIGTSVLTCNSDFIFFPF